MGFLKFLSKSFGNLLIFLALLVLFTGLSFSYAIENIDVLTKSIETRIPEALQANKEIIIKSMLKDQEINLASVKKECLKPSEEMPKDFCEKVKTIKTEEEMKNALIDSLILKAQEEFKPEIQDFEKKLRTNLEEKQVLNYLRYTIPSSIAILILGSLLILLAEKFKWKQALFLISTKTFIISALSSAGNYFTKNLTPEKLENILKISPALKAEEGGGSLAIKLITALLTDWVNIISAKMFIVSLIITIASLTVAVITFLLKREKPSVKEKPEEESTKKVEKQPKKLPKAETKKKKMLFKKK